MTTFSVTKNGNVLDPSLYNWDEKTKTFSTDVDGLVLDFAGVHRVTFNTGYSCTFKTGAYCTFNTASSCSFNTGHSCIFKTGYDCTFNTNLKCTFKTGSECVFNTGSVCIFNTGSDCIFKTGSDCIFEVGDNCSLIRYDVKGMTEIPVNKKIKLNGCGIAGYTNASGEILNDLRII
jgi:hypothetical protein